MDVVVDYSQFDNSGDYVAYVTDIFSSPEFAAVVSQDTKGMFELVLGKTLINEEHLEMYRELVGKIPPSLKCRMIALFYCKTLQDEEADGEDDAMYLATLGASKFFKKHGFNFKQLDIINFAFVYSNVDKGDIETERYVELFGSKMLYEAISLGVGVSLTRGDEARANKLHDLKFDLMFKRIFPN